MGTEMTAQAANNPMNPPAVAGVADALVKEGHRLFRPAGKTTRVDEKGHVRPIMVKVDERDRVIQITEDDGEDHVRPITKMEAIQEEVKALIKEHRGFKGNPKLVSIDFWHLEIQKVDEIEGEFTMKMHIMLKWYDKQFDGEDDQERINETVKCETFPVMGFSNCSEMIQPPDSGDWDVERLDRTQKDDDADVCLRREKTCEPGELRKSGISQGNSKSTLSSENSPLTCRPLQLSFGWRARV